MVKSTVTIHDGLRNRCSIPGSAASDFAPDWPGKHPASYSMGSVAYYPGIKRPEGEAYPSPTSAGFKNEWRYTSTPPYVFMPCTGRTLPTLLP